MQALNHELFLYLNAGPSPGPALLAFAIFCAEYLVHVVTLGLAGVALFAPRRVRLQVAQALLAVLLGTLLAWVVHRYWPQPRPFSLSLGSQWLAHGDRAGLPSNHATGLFSLAFSLLWQRVWRAGAALVLVAVLVSWSRVYVGVHFPLDIVAALPVAVLAAAMASLPWQFGRRLRGPV